MEKKKRRGFTLVELSAVVVIVGILSSTALPNYVKTIDRVKEAEVISLLSAGCMAQYVFFLEHQQFTADTRKLLIGLPQLKDWKYPGIDPSSPTWTLSPNKVQITVTSQGHRHATDDSHQVRGSVDTQGSWLIETKRPGETEFKRLGS